VEPARYGDDHGVRLIDRLSPIGRRVSKAHRLGLAARARFIDVAENVSGGAYRQIGESGVDRIDRKAMRAADKSGANQTNLHHRLRHSFPFASVPSTGAAYWGWTIRRYWFYTESQNYEKP
jgi:hypothetical protein